MKKIYITVATVSLNCVGLTNIDKFRTNIRKFVEGHDSFVYVPTKGKWKFTEEIYLYERYSSDSEYNSEEAKRIRNEIFEPFTEMNLSVNQSFIDIDQSVPDEYLPVTSWSSEYLNEVKEGLSFAKDCIASPSSTWG